MKLFHAWYLEITTLFYVNTDKETKASCNFSGTYMIKSTKINTL